MVDILRTFGRVLHARKWTLYMNYERSNKQSGQYRTYIKRRKLRTRDRKPTTKIKESVPI